MKSNVKDKFNSIPTMDRSSAEQFITLLELPDEQFDAIFPEFKKNFDRVFATPDFQRQIMSQLSVLPKFSLEEEKADLKEFLGEIDEDETLSTNKKALIKMMFNSTTDIIEQLLESGREQIVVKITKLNPNAVIPTYAHPTDCGADVSAVETVDIAPHSTVIIKTGLAVGIPAGYEIQVRPRSGLSAKTPLRIANAPGTIDSDYRGEVGVIMTNTGDEPYVINAGDKVAQLVIAPTPQIKWQEVDGVDDLGETERGAGGFGSTTAGA